MFRFLKNIGAIVWVHTVIPIMYIFAWIWDCLVFAWQALGEDWYDYKVHYKKFFKKLKWRK